MISLTTATIVLTLIVLYYRYFFSYWRLRNIPNLPPNIFFGNLIDVVLGKTAAFDLLHKSYAECKAKGYPYIGYYFLAKPVLVVADPELIKSILVKDFSHFTDREFYLNEKLDPLSAHLASLTGEKWKETRKLLSPAFTSSRLKMMYTYVSLVAKQLSLVLDEAVKKREAVIGRDITSKFTIDIIGMTIFGIDCNTLKNQNLEFQTYGKQILGGSLAQNLKLFMSMLNPRVLYFLRIPFNNPKVQNFFMDLTKTTVEYREKNNVVRKDMMHSLIQLRNNNNLDESQDDDKIKGKIDESSKVLTIEQIAAEALIFFGAAYETTSSIVLFCIHQFILNPDILENARTEVKEVLSRHKDEINYDSIMEMSYLEMCIYETIRMYPPGSTLARVCTKAYPVPGSSVVIEKGTSIFVPAYEIMQDPEYYEEPTKFNPDRYLPENAANRHQFSWLGYGEGPHICIGQRFSLIMAKTFISTLLKSYSFSISPRTKLPLELNRQDILLSFKNDLFLDIKKLQEV